MRIRPGLVSDRRLLGCLVQMVASPMQSIRKIVDLKTPVAYLEFGLQVKKSPN